jgi:hypothetical protein
MDVKSFIESVLVEDRELNDEADGTRAADVAMEDSDDEEVFGRRPAGPRARNIPSRRQMAYVSPRLGVLNNSKCPHSESQSYQADPVLCSSPIRHSFRDKSVHLSTIRSQRSA